MAGVTVGGMLGRAAHEFRQLRRVAGLTQDEVADRAHTSQAVVSAFERGATRNPGIYILERLGVAIGYRLVLKWEPIEPEGTAHSD